MKQLSQETPLNEFPTGESLIPIKDREQLKNKEEICLKEFNEQYRQKSNKHPFVLSMRSDWDSNALPVMDANTVNGIIKKN